MKNILCYGDSITWGYVPGSGERWDENQRWPMLLQKQLGSEFHVIENGINGRTTAFDRMEHEGYLNGVEGLGYALLSSKPLDLVIVLLGLNDLMVTDSFTSARGLKKLCNRILNANVIYNFSSPVFHQKPKLLIISPHVMKRADSEEQYNADFRIAESLQFSKRTKAVAEELGVYWMDSAEIVEASPVDGLHLSAESNVLLANAVTEKVREIFSQN